MKVIYKGKLIEVDGDTIDGKKIIAADNYDKYAAKRERETWSQLESRQRREYGIGNDKVIDNPTSVLWEDNHRL